MTSDQWFWTTVLLGAVFISGLTLVVGSTSTAVPASKPQLELPEASSAGDVDWIKVRHHSRGRSPIVVLPAADERPMPRRQALGEDAYAPGAWPQPMGAASLETWKEELTMAMSTPNGVATLVEIYDCWHGQLVVRIVEELASQLHARPIETKLHCRMDGALFDVAISGCERATYDRYDLLMIRTRRGIHGQGEVLELWPLHAYDIEDLRRAASISNASLR